MLDNQSLSDTAVLLPGLLGHASGALWIPDIRTVLVADVHLGYSWAQRRRGELGPLVDEAARVKLNQLAADFAPQQFVFLGDLVHAPRPCAPERQWTESVLTELSQRAKLVAVRGNHDRAFAREFGHLSVTTMETWSMPGILALHGDRLARAPILENGTLIMGHLHPSFSLRDAAGANHRVRLFLVTESCIVLPAFSPFARGFDVAEGLPLELGCCFGAAPIQAFAATGSRVAALGPLQGAIERMWQSSPSTPGHFRRRARCKGLEISNVKK